MTMQVKKKLCDPYARYYLDGTGRILQMETQKLKDTFRGGRAAQVFVWVWVTSVVLLCSAPLTVKVHLHTKGHLHDLGHVCVFFFTGLLLSFRYFRHRYLRYLWIPSALGLGAFTELLENGVYNAHFEWADVGFDSIGVLLAAALSMLWPLVGRQKQEATFPRP